MVSISSFKLMLKKTLRDYQRLLAPALVLSLVMSAGLSSLIMSRSAFKSLLISKEITYQKLRFADLSIPLVHMPRTALTTLKRFPEIKTTDCRISVDGQVMLPQEKQNIKARFHSLPKQKSSLNGLRILEGQMPKRSSQIDALLSDAFARAWNIRTGDWVEILLKGQKLKFRVSGLVRSAEYVYQAGSSTSIPEDRLFSVWWINQSILEHLTHLNTACNDLLIELQRDSSWHALKIPIEKVLKPYGYTQIIPRSRQISNYFIESELIQLEAMAIIIPAVFLSITIFLLHITMMRVLLTQREQIGTLTAFGIRRRDILVQTLTLGILCLLPGALIGVLIGWWLSAQLFAIYLQFYRFAYSAFHFDTQSAWLSVGICFATGLLGSINAVQKILRATPAENLKPSPPSHTRATPFDTIALLNRLSFTTRMSIRNLFRRPLQTIVTITGLSLALALLIFARFERTAISQLLEEEFNSNQRQTHTILLGRRLPTKITTSVRTQLPDGLLEPHLSLPVILERGLANRELTLNVENKNQILRGDSNQNQKISFQSGMSLSSTLAEALNLKIGDYVTVSTREIFPEKARIQITSLNDNLMGYVAGISKHEFQILWRVPHSTNNFLFYAKQNQTLDIKPLTQKIPIISGVLEKKFERDVFEKTVSQNIGLFENFMIGFAILISGGVLYNNARIQFAERQAELSLLRAVGFLEEELTLIFWSDYIILLVISFLPGLLLGRWFVQWIVKGIETEMFRIPFDMNAATYIWACLFLILGIILAGVFIQPKIRKIPFLTVLKTRE